jgi:hypothetical protein
VNRRLHLLHYLPAHMLALAGSGGFTSPLLECRETLDKADDALEKVAESLDAMQQRVAPEQGPAEAAGAYQASCDGNIS